MDKNNTKEKNTEVTTENKESKTLNVLKKIGVYIGTLYSIAFLTNLYSLILPIIGIPASKLMETEFIQARLAPWAGVIIEPFRIIVMSFPPIIFTGLVVGLFYFGINKIKLLNKSEKLTFTFGFTFFLFLVLG